MENRNIEIKQDNVQDINHSLEIWIYPYLPELLFLILSLIIIYLKNKISNLENYLSKIFDKNKNTNINQLKATELQEILYNILHNSNADRVCLLEFHNGINRGKRTEHYIKFSITFEVVKLGISKISNIIKDISKTLIIEELNELKNKDYIKLDRKDNNPSTLLITGIREIYLFKISDYIEDGFIMLIYSHDSECFINNSNLCFSEDNKELMNEIKLLSNSIKYYLNY